MNGVWAQPPPQALRFSQGGDEPQGTMGRVQTASDARSLLPAFLCARERDVWVRGRSGFVCSMSISLSFLAPTSSIDLNSNNKKLIKWLLRSNRRESLRTTQKAFLIRNDFWVSRGRRQGTQNIRGRVSVRKNGMKPFVRTLFLGTKPPCLSSPGRPFFCTDDRKPKL